MPYSRVGVKDFDLKRVQEEVERSFQSIPDPVTNSDGIVRVDTANGTRAYTIKPTDRHVVCITIAGPITVSLPNPKDKRLIGIVASGANKATVQRADGKVMSFGASKELQDSASLFVADGQDWYLE